MITKKRAIRFHHLAIPMTLSIPPRSPGTDEIHNEQLGYSYVPGSSNRYGIEWVRYHPGCGFPSLIQNNAHVAFEVENIARIASGENIIVAPYLERPGVKAAFLELLDFPVKLMEIDHRVAGPEYVGALDRNEGRLKYHHSGIPRAASWDREIKVPHLKLAYLPGKYNSFGVELLRFEEGNANPDVIKLIPHVAYEVDDMEAAMKGEKVVYGPNRETPGIAVSMIEVAGATVEFLELNRSIVGDQYDA